MFALGLLSWLYTRPMAGTETVPEEQVRRQARDPRGQPRGAARRLQLRRDDRGLRGHLRDRPGPDAGRHLPQHHRQHRAGLRPGRGGPPRRAAAVPRLLPDHAGLRHPAHARGAQALRRDHLPGRGRDRRRRRGARRVLRRRARRHHDLGPGPRAQGRDDRPGRVARAAAGRRRRPARRPLDRPADQDRAVRPAAGDVRPQRRVAGADRRPAAPPATASPRAGGRADRHDLPHAGAPAVRRLPRQRLRAVAASRTWPTCPSCGVEFATEPNGTDAKGNPVFHPYLRDPETLARPWAIPGTPGLEHRIGGIEKADVTGNISYDPDNHDRMARLRQAKVDGIADTIPDARGRRPDRRRRGARARLGLDLRPDRRRPPGWSATPARRSPRRTCATSTRSRPTPARCSAATGGSSCRR